MREKRRSCRPGAQKENTTSPSIRQTMAEKKDKAEQERRQFVHETVTGGRNRKKRLIKRVLFTALCAVVFGLLAGLTFALTKPFWEENFGEAETVVAEPIIIFETMPSMEVESAVNETEQVTGTETNETGETGEGSDEEQEYWAIVKPYVDKAIADKSEEIITKDAPALGRRDIVSAVTKSLVKVSTDNTVNGLDYDVMQEESTSGVIVAITGSEILVLTDSDILRGDETLYVVFANSLMMPAKLKAADRTFGLAVLSVNRTAWSQSQIDGIAAISMGSSTAIYQGQTLIAMGAPLGYYKSVLTGSVAYINSNVQGADTSARILHTDLARTEDTSGILVNLEGQLVGWITDRYGEYTGTDYICAIALFDISTSIEKLSNGKELVLLGIIGQNVTPAMSQQYGLPQGIYINNCVPETPADEAGIQNGDILTAINGKEVNTFTDLSQILPEYYPGRSVLLTVQRQQSGEYSELKLTATLVAR